MDSAKPNDQQILNFIFEPNDIMKLWCRRQIQMYVDEIDNRENSEFIADVLFQNIKPVRFKEPGWDTDDSIIMGLLPLSATGKLGRKNYKNVAKLVRMVYFLEFFNTNNQRNSFTGKFEFTTNYQAVMIFKSVFFKEHVQYTRQAAKRRQTV
tara:strand:- start:111 stop:566 length:456 start_codon:yes stop_codon:yes gene_type:complete